MAFNRDNRDRNSRGGDRGGFRPRPSFSSRGRPASGWGDRGDRGPVEMHSAVCENCGRECEVPFRPTSGKPVYCSNCFENQRSNLDSGNSGNSGRFERRNFERPRNEQSTSPSQDKFAELNAKLDSILKLLENQKPVVKKPAKIKEAKTEEVAPTAEE